MRKALSATLIVAAICLVTISGCVRAPRLSPLPAEESVAAASTALEQYLSAVASGDTAAATELSIDRVTSRSLAQARATYFGSDATGTIADVEAVPAQGTHAAANEVQLFIDQVVIATARGSVTVENGFARIESRNGKWLVQHVEFDLR